VLGGDCLRVKFQTTVEKELIEKLKIEAIQQGKNVNDILEELIRKYFEAK
jgi:predicted HicB family RNase H-like nuclease